MSDLRVVLGPVEGNEVRLALGAVDGVDLVATSDLDEASGALAEAEVFVTYQWRPDLLTERLRWVQSISVGVDHFPLDELADAGIVLTSARGIHGPQVAEHVFGMLLAMTRGIAVSVRDQLERRWRWPRVTELGGRTMGILGLGVIGEAVATRARAFGMRVIGTKRRPEEYAGVAKEVYGPEDTLAVFEASDVVVITLPGGPETTGIVGEAELAALRGGWLVNVGRGTVVDEASLVAAVEDGVLAGAALDVFSEEPLPKDSPLWALDSVLVTPHVAGVSPHYGERLAEVFAVNLAAHRGEGPWVNRVV